MSDKNIEEDINQSISETELNTETQHTGEEQEVLSIEEELRVEVDKEKDKFLRLFAEFENYKKRTSKERMELFKTAGQEIMVALLPVLDDFDRALNELSKSGNKEMFKGINLIKEKFQETLNSKGLEEVAAKPGDVFDADIHDAITQIPAPNKKLKGKIIDVIEKGFKLGEKNNSSSKSGCRQLNS